MFDSNDERYNVQRNGNAQANIVVEIHAINLPNFYKGVVNKLRHSRRNYIVVLKNFLALEVDGKKFNFRLGNFAKKSCAYFFKNFFRNDKLLVDVAVNS